MISRHGDVLDVPTMMVCSREWIYTGVG